MASPIAVLVSVSDVHQFRQQLSTLDRQDTNSQQFTVVTIDDGLDVAGREQLRKLAQYRPNLVVVETAEAGGFPAALAACSQELVLPLDQSDRLYPSALSVLSDAADHADVVFGKPVSTKASSAVRALLTTEAPLDADAARLVAGWLPALVRRGLLDDLSPNASLAHVRSHAVDRAASYALASDVAVAKVVGSPSEELTELTGRQITIGSGQVRWVGAALTVSTSVSGTSAAGLAPGSIRLWVRELRSGVEWPLETAVELSSTPGAWDVSALVDVTSAAHGRSLARGVWAVVVQVTAQDGARGRRLAVADVPGPALLDGRAVVPTTADDRFALDVGATVANPVDNLDPAAARITEGARGTRLVLPLPFAVVRSHGPLVAQIRLGTFPLKAEVTVDNDQAQLESWLSGLPGREPLSVSLGSSPWHPTGTDLVINPTGEMTLQRGAPDTKPSPPKQPAKPRQQPKVERTSSKAPTGLLPRVRRFVRPRTRLRRLRRRLRRLRSGLRDSAGAEKSAPSGAGTNSAPSAPKAAQPKPPPTWLSNVHEGEFFRRIAAELDPRPRAKVVILGGGSAPLLEKALLGLYPELRIVAVEDDADVSRTHVQLSASNPYNLILDVSETSAAEQVDLFCRTFFHLGRHATYLVREVLPVTDPDCPVAPEGRGNRITDGLDLAGVLRLASETPYDSDDPIQVRDLAVLGQGTEDVTVIGKSLLVRNARRVRPKLRDDEINTILALRPELGSLIASRPGGPFASRCDYQESPGHLDERTGKQFVDPHRLAVFDVPDLHLRLYHQPTCGRGQVVESQGLLLPDTYRQHRRQRLSTVYVNEALPLFGDVRGPLGDPVPLVGAYFHFDSEWPGHFGHTMTEQISRLWAYQRAKELEPGLKLLTALPRSRADQRLQGWELALLEPYGIGADDVVIFDQAVRPERLYAATGMFSCPEYVHPDITEIWSRIGNQLATQADERHRPRRIFCSRRTGLKRACRNTPEVEEFFASRGFTVVYPEDHPMAEQVALFRAADVVAGFGGSGLFTMAFCETPKTVIMIIPESYTARNEYLFASVRGHRLRVAWSKPDIPHPEGRWTVEAFSSSYVVDLDDEGRYLADVLDSLDR